MELQHPQHFVALAQESSFTRAARKVNIVQSGLSNSIKELEEELGSRLVERTTRKVAITETGMLFLPHARATLASLEGAVHASSLPGWSRSRATAPWHPAKPRLLC